MSFFTAFSGLVASVALGLNYGAREAALAAVAAALAFLLVIGRSR